VHAVLDACKIYLGTLLLPKLKLIILTIAGCKRNAIQLLVSISHDVSCSISCSSCRVTVVDPSSTPYIKCWQ